MEIDKTVGVVTLVVGYNQSAALLRLLRYTGIYLFNLSKELILVLSLLTVADLRLIIAPHNCKLTSTPLIGDTTHTILLIILDNLDISLNIVHNLQAVPWNLRLKSKYLVFDQLRQLHYFQVFDLEVFVLLQDRFVPLLGDELTLVLLVELFEHAGVGDLA